MRPGDAEQRHAPRPRLGKAMRLAIGIVLTGMFFLVVGAALVPKPSLAMGVVAAVAVICAVVFYRTFPSNRLFQLTFANLVAVYTSIFAVYLQISFPALPADLVAAGYILPVVAFVAGTALRRKRVREIVEADIRRGFQAGQGADPGVDGGMVPVRPMAGGAQFLWLLPLAGIGLAALILPALSVSLWDQTAIFVAAMLAISLLVGLVSAQVAAFLVETSLVFADLLARFARLGQPIFAFLSFYSMIVIVFAAMYRVIDRIAGTPQFEVAGTPAHIEFADALYFSIVTLSTLGYGDIVPASSAVQVLVAIEVVLGLLLLLFGFGEIINAARKPPPE